MCVGIDLSQGDDFCAFTFLFPLKKGAFGVRTVCYITSLTLDKLPGAIRMKYDQFLKESSLQVLEGSVLDLDDVYDDIERYIVDSNFDVRAVGFDPYNAKAFMTRWEQENGPYALEKVIQGAKTESVPLELKTLSEQGMLIFDQNDVFYHG